MQSRRDQVQAHLFVMGRLATGMLRGEPDTPDTPVSRTTKGTAAGVALGFVICLAMGAFGFIVPGGATDWQKAGTLVEVKETGARFLYLAGELHPVLNEASARLIAGAQMTVDQVSEASLTGTVRGTPVGILGAPDSLPGAAELTSGPWSLCAGSEPAVLSRSGTATAAGLALAVSASNEGTPLADGQALLVATPGGDEYLLWHGERLRLPEPTTVVQALGYASVTPAPVPSALLDTLPAGPDLASPTVIGLGTTGPVLAGRPTRLGQLFTGPSGDRYLLTAAGLTPLTSTLFDLLRGDPQVQRLAYAGGPVTVTDVGPADLAGHSAPAAVVPAGAGSLPATPPVLVPAPGGQDVCVALQLSTTGPPALSLTLVAAATVSGQQPMVIPGVAPGCGTLDAVSVPPGGGVWLRALSGAGVGAATYLLTDAGVKYPVPTSEAATQLGYNTVTPVAVPQSLLDLLPTGPSLDPVALASSGGVVGPGSDSPVCPGEASTTASPSAG